MPRSTSPFKRAPLDQASFGLFGVIFVYDNAGRSWQAEYLRSITPLQTEVLQEIRLATLWAIERQDREYVSYVDAMTWFDTTTRPKRLSARRIPEMRLLGRLMRSLASKREDHLAIKDLAEEPSLQHVVTQHKWDDSKFTIDQVNTVPRTDLSRIGRTRQGKHRLIEPTMYRLFRVPMGDAGGSLKDIDVDRLLVLSLLVQIRCDLELLHETGFRRLRRCERKRCKAWYTSKSMGQQIKFCCDVCRASDYRESRTTTKPRSRAPQRQR